jgi:hypothetical protein
MFTRNQSSAEHIAVNALLALRRSNYAVTAEVTPALTVLTTKPASATKPTPPTKSTPPTKPVANARFWTEWTNWYHTFLSEATDEFPSLPIAERRSEATSRWVTFTAKQLNCPESIVRAWLRTANQKKLVAAYS